MYLKEYQILKFTAMFFNPLRAVLLPKLLLVSLFLFGAVEVFAQGTPKLYVTIDDLDDDTQNYLKQNGVGEAKMVYGKFIYPKNPMVLDEATLVEHIKEIFPDPNASGIAVLDWEGRAHTALQFRKDEKLYQTALNGFLKALRLAKKTRPNVKWGYYGLPFRRIKGVGKVGDMAEWKKSCDNILPILKESDALYVSLYSTYPVGEQQELAYAKADLDNAVAYAKQLGGKPVYPIVWHRYQKVYDNKRYKVVSKSEFEGLMKIIGQASKQGKNVPGVIWWGRDSRFYDASQKEIAAESASGGAQPLSLRSATSRSAKPAAAAPKKNPAQSLRQFSTEASNRQQFVNQYHTLIKDYSKAAQSALKQ
jgi:hypothetical protein